MNEDYIQVFMTTETKEDAQSISSLLVGRRLAACIQIVGPIQSTYWWKGKIDLTEEWLCIIKSKRSLYEELEAEIKRVHPYEIPEITAIPIVTGSKDYLGWMDAELKG